MTPIAREISARSDADVERSCNCCNNMICNSECCCFPFFRRRRHHNITTEKVDEIGKKEITKINSSFNKDPERQAK